MQNKSRIIGIDFGLARIGIAVSDESKILATPLTTVTAEKKLENTVDKLIELLDTHQKEHNYTLEAIVVGLPLMMSGKMGLMSDEVGHFVETLKKKTSIPIKTWDERLTSAQADRSLREFSLSRKKRAKVVDKVSAVLILQNYLDTVIV